MAAGDSSFSFDASSMILESFNGSVRRVEAGVHTGELNRQIPQAQGRLLVPTRL